MRKLGLLSIVLIVLLSVLAVSCKKDPGLKQVKTLYSYGECYDNGADGTNDYYTDDDSSDAVYRQVDSTFTSSNILDKGTYTFAAATCSHTTEKGKLYFGGSVQNAGDYKKACYWVPEDSGAYTLHLCNETDTINIDKVQCIAVDGNGKVYVAANAYGSPSYAPGYYDGSTWKLLEGFTGTAFGPDLIKRFEIPRGGMGFNDAGNLIVIATNMGQYGNNTNPHYSRPAYWQDGTFHALYGGEGLQTAEAWIEGFTFENGTITAYGENSLSHNRHIGYYQNQGTLPNWTQTVSDYSYVNSGLGFFKDGTDIYLSGTQEKDGNTKQGYFKNGAFHEVAGYSPTGMAGDIHVDGTDIYLVGQKEISAGVSEEGIFKNDVFTKAPAETGKELTIHGIGYNISTEVIIIN